MHSPLDSALNTSEEGTATEIQTPTNAPSIDAVIPDDPPVSADVHEKKSSKFKLTIWMLCTISVCVAMDSVIVAACLPSINVSLGGTSVKTFWVGTSYLLAQTVGISNPSDEGLPPADHPTRLQFRYMGQYQTFCR
jgi:hypothetical protein